MSDDGGFDQNGRSGVVRNGQILHFGSILRVELTNLLMTSCDVWIKERTQRRHVFGLSHWKDGVVSWDEEGSKWVDLGVNIKSLFLDMLSLEYPVDIQEEKSSKQQLHLQVLKRDSPGDKKDQQKRLRRHSHLGWRKTMESSRSHVKKLS